VQGRKLRLSTIVADVPKEGKSGVDLDAVTTLAAEAIAKFAKDEKINDLSPMASLKSFMKCEKPSNR